jgi:hypothetical protein
MERSNPGTTMQKQGKHSFRLPIHAPESSSATGIKNFALLLNFIISVLITCPIIGLCLLFWGPDATRLESIAYGMAKKDPQDKLIEPVLLTSLEWRRLIFGGNDASTAQTLKYLAKFYYEHQRLTDYERELKEAESIQAQNFETAQQAMSSSELGNYIRSWVDTLLELSSWNLRQNKPQDAHATLQKVISLSAKARLDYAQERSLTDQCRILSSRLPESPAQSLQYVSTALNWRGILDRAMDHIQKFYSDMTAYQHLRRAVATIRTFLTGTSDFETETGNYSVAEADLREIVAQEKLVPEMDYYSILALKRLATISSLDNKYDQAEGAYNSVLERLRRTHSKNQDVYIAVSLQSYAEFLAERGQFETSRQLAEQAAILLRNSTGKQ